MWGIFDVVDAPMCDVLLSSQSILDSETLINNKCSQPNKTNNVRSKVEKSATNLKIVSWNIRGLTDKVFEQNTQDALFQNDIIILTETHNEQGSQIYYNVIPNFIYNDFPRKFKHRRAPKASGGIGIYIRSNLQKGIKIESYHESIIILTLKAQFFKLENSIHIICSYFPPADSSYNHSTNSRTDYFDILQEALSNIQTQDDLIICGDLNARTGNLSDMPEHLEGSDGALSELLGPHDISYPQDIPERQTVDPNINDYGRQLINLCRSLGLCIMNGRIGDVANNKDFTCIKTGGASVVDYVICKPDTIPLIEKLTLIQKRPESDHRPVSFSICMPTQVKKQIVTGELALRTTHQYRWDQNKKKDYATTFNEDHLIGIEILLIDKISDTKTPCEEICNTFNKYIDTAIRTFFKKKRSASNKFPVNRWFNDECKTLKRQVVDYARNHDIRETEHSEQYRQLEQNYNRVKQREKRNYTEEIRERLENFSGKDPASYWKMWKSLKHNTVNNSILTLNDFETYFKSQIYPPEVDSFDKVYMDEIKNFVIKYETSELVLNRTVDDPLANEICNAPITHDEVTVHLKKLKNNKSAGTDGLVAEFIKYAPDKIASILCAIFNRIFSEGNWPDSWAEGLISPVHKKDSINKADNYRKITVMPALGKLLESILNARLKFKNVVLDLDDIYQFGFKENCRTSDNAFILYSLITRQKFKKKPLFTCFVDFTKAFDYVNRYALYYKLIHRGVNGNMLKLICDMYNKAKCRVKWKGQVGGEIESEFGVLQGGMMSPKLFTEFLHDLKEYLAKQHGAVLGSDILTYMLFADDLVLCSDSDKGLQNLINGLYNFCRKWHLIVSMTKTNVVIFGKHNSSHTFKYGENVIQIAQKYKYLGTTFSSENNVFKTSLM
jgi:exonuclease III/hypoxanthine phosphoribosyltransferase